MRAKLLGALKLFFCPKEIRFTQGHFGLLRRGKTARINLKFLKKSISFPLPHSPFSPLC